MKRLTILITLFCLALLPLLAQPAPVQIPDHSVNLKDFGAVPDGQTLNTEAFEKAISALNKKGGGRLVVPEGLWLTGPISLKNCIDLHLERGALVLFSPDKTLYLKDGSVRPAISASKRHDVSISGEGILDGNGGFWRPVKRGKVSDVEWKEYLKKGGEVTEDGSLWYAYNLKGYENIGPDDLRKNFKYFLDAVIPVCEEVGVRMACHPDDPAWPIFGLPRITHSQEDFDKMVQLHDSPANTLCLCTGSLGSNPENDIPAIIRHFGEMNRIGAMHVRNVKYLGYHHFREAAHLSSTGDLDLYEIVKAIYETCPDTYIRPDHGRMIWDEQGRPGYGLYDRALGAAYINGLWEAIDKESRK